MLLKFGISAAVGCFNIVYIRLTLYNCRNERLTTLTSIGCSRETRMKLYITCIVLYIMMDARCNQLAKNRRLTVASTVNLVRPGDCR